MPALSPDPVHVHPRHKLCFKSVTSARNGSPAGRPAAQPRSRPRTWSTGVSDLGRTVFSSLGLVGSLLSVSFVPRINVLTALSLETACVSIWDIRVSVSFSYLASTLCGEIKEATYFWSLQTITIANVSSLVFRCQMQNVDVDLVERGRCQLTKLASGTRAPRAPRNSRKGSGVPLWLLPCGAEFPLSPCRQSCAQQ